ncbi:hypothetical protein ACHAXM_010725 [Skeletonema potamos]|jgi:hypothetical protein
MALALSFHSIFIHQLRKSKSNLLEKGMKLLTINNIDASGPSSKEAVKILKDAEGKRVLTAKKSLSLPTFYTYKVELNSAAETMYTGRESNRDDAA